MATILCKTRGNVNPKGKPRVFFTCHPADFEKYFEKICEDIFNAHDCAIYYTEDMSAPIAAEDLTTDLGSNNLFVIPVTRKLLTQPNRAMNQDFAYAKKEHIPVLPIMMELGIDDLYMQPSKFGSLQYLNPNSNDDTEIAYGRKLSKYLESVLVSDETAKRIRAAFDAYIFLSYRKQDRRYANELMRLIHKNPLCRDIAIWFDEFLTPGESFRDSIDKILHDSKLFTLLVTPNLLEDANFVMAEEYPAAKASGIHILPAEMVPTDKTALSEKFRDIPDCVDVSDEGIFHQHFLDALEKAAITTNDTDPEHNFLIGLAYLKGIDVEVDRQRGVELITSAAEANLPEAMEQLYTMYLAGLWVPLNYKKAAFWADALVNYHKNASGEEHPSTLHWMDTLSFVYIQLGNFQKAKQLASHVYTLQCKLFGEDSADCIAALNHFAISCDELGEYRKARELKEKVYELQCKHFGEEDPTAITMLSNLSLTLGKLGLLKTALSMAKKAYEQHCKVLGEEHLDTLRSLSNLAIAYSALTDHKKSAELNEQVYTLRCKILGEYHPYTLISMNNLAAAYCDLGDYKKSSPLKSKVYALYYNILGEDHPKTLLALSNLAIDYYRAGDYQEAVKLWNNLHAYRFKLLGETHPDTLKVITYLVDAYVKLEDFENAVKELYYLQSIQYKSLGASHAATLDTMGHLGEVLIKQGKRRKGLRKIKLVYLTKYGVLGEEHPSTIRSMQQLADAYETLGKHKKAAALKESANALMSKGPRH